MKEVFSNLEKSNYIRYFPHRLYNIMLQLYLYLTLKSEK
jgi:ABC-type long-subunit fatty acid transport system fused permease/ATPase subunit